MLEIHDDEIFTQVIHFEVDPGKQAALIDAIASEGERWVRHYRARARCARASQGKVAGA